MTRQDGAPIGRTTPADQYWHGVRQQGIPVHEIVVDDMTGGMVSTRPRGQIPKSSGRLVRNARVRDYWVGRRPGTAVFITAPDSNPVYKLLSAYLPSNQKWVVRITDSDIHAARSLDGWQALTGTGLTGTSRIVSAQYQDLVFIASRDAKIIKIDLETSTYAEVDGAPRARFITVFADRLVAAGIAPDTLGSTKIQWSANGFPEEWDALENEGAGEENLITSPSDTGDDITGLHALTQEMLILRERSIWMATRQPIVFAPFRFQPISVNHGCDLPYSAVKVENGVMWADYRSKGVWLFQPGSLPIRVSEEIDDKLYEDLENLKWAEGSYDPFDREYHLGLATAPGEQITKIWVFNFKTRAWAYDDTPIIQTIGQTVQLDDLIMIDELLGVIDDQNPAPSGVIDDWEGNEVLPTGILKGTSTGEVLIQSYDADNDWNAFNFEFEWQSHSMASYERRRTLTDLMLTIEAPVTGTATLQESKDEISWVNDKVVSITGATNRQRIGLPRRQLTGNDLFWRISSDCPQLRLTSWWVRMLDKFLQRQQTT